MDEAHEKSKLGANDSTPGKSVVVPLASIVEWMEMQSETMCVYLDPATGDFVVIGDKQIFIARTGSDKPQPEDDDIDWTVDDAEAKGFIGLPDRYDIHEYQMMVDFAETVEDVRSAERLSTSLRGSGAFRRFKDTVRLLGLEQAWYKFREQAYEAAAIEWCRENGIEFTR
jgi:hypothetical protein